MFNYNEEIICDYLVTAEKKRIWGKQLMLLSELDRVCRKYDIQYFAVCGTLLGAIRHKGFIPWDDDMDVGLLREDYNKLLSHADEFQEPFFLQNIFTDSECYTHTSRLRDSNSTAIVLQDKNCKCNHGIYIDIFPFDHLIDNHLLRFVQFAILTVFSRLLQYSKAYYLGKESGFKYLISNLVTNFFNYEKVFSRYQEICSMYNKFETKQLGILSGNKLSKEFRYPLVACKSIMQVPFEDCFINVPVGFDDCLKINYGEYMQFPPLEKRGAWHDGVLLINPDVDFKTIQKQNGWL